MTPSDYLHCRLPDHVSLEEGALLEPLSVGVHACQRAGITLGSQVLILGAGPIGLVTLLVAKSLGATKIVITGMEAIASIDSFQTYNNMNICQNFSDLVQSRLDVAKKMGANDTILVQRSDDEATMVKKVHDTFGCEPDKTIDASGAEASTRLATLVSFTAATENGYGIKLTETDFRQPEPVVRQYWSAWVLRKLSFPSSRPWPERSTSRVSSVT